ncbi:hypothetical protein GGI21_003952, partial [Coemansia aciculifera]
MADTENNKSLLAGPSSAHTKQPIAARRSSAGSSKAGSLRHDVPRVTTPLRSFDVSANVRSYGEEAETMLPPATPTSCAESGTMPQPTLWQRFSDPESYPEITIRRAVFFFIWTIPHIIICAVNGSNTGIKLVKRMNRTAMSCVLLDVAAILVFMSPTLLMLLRRTFLPRFITFEKNIHAHKVASYTMLFWALVHVGIYVQRYSEEAKPHLVKGKMVPGIPFNENMYSRPTGWTGVVLVHSFVLLVATSIKPIRQRLFEVFYYIHHLFILCTVFLFIHGDNKRAYKYLTGPIVVYCADRLYRNLRTAFAKSPIRAVIQHPSGVFEIQLDKKIIGHRPGQYVRLYCPSVSLLQWHPITISSAPEEELLTLHIRLAGGWTKSLAQRLGCRFATDARSSTIQKVVAVSAGLKALTFGKCCHSAALRDVAPAPLLDIPYHPLRHDPTTVPMYSQAGGSSSYISIDMVAKGGGTAIRGSLAMADDDGKLKPT